MVVSGFNIDWRKDLRFPGVETGRQLSIGSDMQESSLTLVEVVEKLMGFRDELSSMRSRIFFNGAMG